MLVIIMLHSTWKVYLKKRESVSMRDSSTVRLQELESRNEELDLKIKKLSTTSGVEEEIRSKFSVAKDRENMVIVVREESSTSTEAGETTGFW